ncbi:MAG TPA: aminotransferase class I/II-fold pyridoxal phosphate-dependent enzyme [Candidatus Polarisedimenticolia bacterium]|nr:aminotransferase class I/II-fold pyridoxal phosphate-dependent enzyme [Candidatus Polarisedimenticolia bacterium]
MADGPRELELGSETMRRMAELAMDRIVEHIGSLPSQPASYDTSDGPDLARSLAEGLPEQGSPFEELLALLFERVVPASFNTAGPGYLAYIPGGGLFHAAIADLIADAVNRYVGVFQAAPGLAQIEANVVRWFSGIVGYPAAAGGFLTTGGSLANLSAVITAREEKLGEAVTSGVVYVSDQTHHSVARAARLAGIPPGRVRSLPGDESGRLDAGRLREAVAADRRRGLRPFLVCGNAGTTNTGAVDDLEALACAAREEGLWLHVDAAYGGFFMLTERGRARMKGIDQADSITLDPHKGLFLPYGTGCLLARDGGALRRTHAHHADYLPPMQQDSGLVDFCDISPELSRDARGLRVWLPLKMHGAGAFRRSLDEKLDLAAWAAAELSAIPGVDVVAPPQLSLLAFRLSRPGRPREEMDRLNRSVLERVNAGGRVFLTGAVLPSGFVLRICVLSFRTHADRMREAIDAVRQAASEV